MQHARGDWPHIGLNDALKETHESKKLESVTNDVRDHYVNVLLNGDTPSRGRPDPKGNPNQGNRAKRRADAKAKRREAGKERNAATPR